MNYTDYIYQKKKLYDSLFTFLEDDDQSDEEEEEEENGSRHPKKGERKMEFLETISNSRNEEDIEQFLIFLSKILDNHHRNSGFIDRIGKILLYLKDTIKQTLSNLRIHEMFEGSFLFLLLLLENEIVKFDEQIINLYENFSEQKKFYFYPEIKNMISDADRENIEGKLLQYDLFIFISFSEKRRAGENDDRLCSIIREDSLDDFLSYITEEKVPLNSEIKYSIFETNRLLIEIKKVTLIEYTAFFGAVQIFHYLRTHEIELSPHIWKFAVHSKSLEIIHFLIENKIEPDFEPKDDEYSSFDLFSHLSVDERRDLFFQEILEEAIKCHHNEVANYIIINIIQRDIEKFNDEKYFNDNVLSYAFHYHNYLYFPENLDEIDFIFLYACKFGYFQIVDLLLNTGKININKQIISKKKYFFSYHVDNQLFEYNSNFSMFIQKRFNSIFQ